MSELISVPAVIAKKRDGGTLTKQEIDYFIQEVVGGGIQESQIGAMLMAIYLRGMNIQETVHLTKAMAESGDVLTWNKTWTVVDKHSTGGVGDKISLSLAPALAAVGFKVPMISGRGLEFTGGTLDKLESIPGFKASCNLDELNTCLAKAGCFIAGATGKLAPADRELYKLRDVTGTVKSTPLIVGSIISKKVAEGTQYLVMDVKVGNAAFFKTAQEARELADQLVKVSSELGVKVKAVLTRMDTPIGSCVGNSLEVAESVLCMKGQGRPDLLELVTTFGGLVLEMNGKVKNLEEGKSAIKTVLNNGEALKCFQEMLVCQGVKKNDANELCNGDMWKILPKVPEMQITTLATPSKGVITNMDALKIGHACWGMGAGRSKADQPIDYRVGVKILKFIGDSVEKGDPWIDVHHATPTLSNELKNKFESSIIIAPQAAKAPPRVIEICSL